MGCRLCELVRDNLGSIRGSVARPCFYGHTVNFRSLVLFWAVWRLYCSVKVRFRRSDNREVAALVVRSYVGRMTEYLSFVVGAILAEK